MICKQQKHEKSITLSGLLVGKLVANTFVTLIPLYQQYWVTMWHCTIFSPLMITTCFVNCFPCSPTPLTNHFMPLCSDYSNWQTISLHHHKPLDVQIKARNKNIANSYWTTLTENEIIKGNWWMVHLFLLFSYQYYTIWDNNRSWYLPVNCLMP